MRVIIKKVLMLRDLIEKGIAKEETTNMGGIKAVIIKMGVIVK